VFGARHNGGDNLMFGDGHVKWTATASIDPHATTWKGLTVLPSVTP